MNHSIATEPRSNRSNPYSWPRTLLLHLGPSAAVMGAILALVPALRALSWPLMVAPTLAFLFVSIPIRLGYLWRASKSARHNPNMLAAVDYPIAPRRRSDAVLAVALIVYAVALSAVLAPINTALSEGLFAWMPSFLRVDEDLSTFPVTVAVAAVALKIVVDGVLHPIIEEMYFRGHLLNRIPAATGPAAVASAVLFAIQHLWQPWNAVMIFLLVLPWGLVVRRTHSLGVTVLVHCTVNTLGATLLLVSVVGGN